MSVIVWVIVHTFSKDSSSEQNGAQHAKKYYYTDIDEIQEFLFFKKNDVFTVQGKILN